MSTTPSEPPAFPSHARRVMRAVRGAFAELIAAVGADPQDVQDLTRTCSLNKNLAWKVSKLVQTDDPAIALQQMPGSAGIEIFLKNMQKTGAAEELVQTARDAIAEFEELIRLHSGDRATLEMMGSALSTSGRQQRDEYHRKLLFRGGSYVWGAQARVMLKVGIVGLGAEEGLLDFASLGGLLDFRRLRPEVSWAVASRGARNDDGSAMFPPGPEPIDQRCDPDGPPLMLDFCSRPLPELTRVDEPTGIAFELPQGPVGNTGALTCVTGTVQRGLPYWRSPTNMQGEHAVICNIPAQAFVFDLFIHEKFDFAIPPEMALYSEIDARIPFPARRSSRNELPIHETLQDLGTGPLPLATPEVPQYNNMVKAVFDRCGWSPTTFRGFRVKIAYPTCPATLVLRYPLPEKP
jgi:hypothetical protein